MQGKIRHLLADGALLYQIVSSALTQFFLYVHNESLRLTERELMILEPLCLKPKQSCCSLHSLAPGPIHFRISWETRGIFPRDGIASNVDTKEVIDGTGGFFGSSDVGRRVVDVGVVVVVTVVASLWTLVSTRGVQV